jgi:hypothetical protein
MSCDTLVTAPAAPDTPAGADSLRTVPQRPLGRLIGTLTGTRSEAAR